MFNVWLPAGWDGRWVGWNGMTGRVRVGADGGAVIVSYHKYGVLHRSLFFILVMTEEKVAKRQTADSIVTHLC